MLHYKAVARTRREKASDIALMVFGLIAAGYTSAMTLKVRSSRHIFPTYSRIDATCATADVRTCHPSSIAGQPMSQRPSRRFRPSVLSRVDVGTLSWFSYRFLASPEGLICSHICSMLIAITVHRYCTCTRNFHSRIKYSLHHTRMCTQARYFPYPTHVCLRCDGGTSDSACR